MANTRWFPYLLIVGAGIFWGSTFSLTLLATADGAHPITLTTWQVLLTAILFMLISRSLGHPVFRFRHLGIYSLLATLGIIAPDLMYYSAAPNLSAGILSVTISAVPMFTYAIMLGMRFETLVMKRTLGIMMGMISILLLSVPDLGLESSHTSLWVLVVVGCALCYAVENVYLGEGVDSKIEIYELLSGSNMVAAVILLPSMAMPEYGVSLSWFFTPPAWAIMGVALTSSCAYMMFFYTIKASGPVFASQCSYIVTISGVIWGILIFSESHSLWVWSSVAVMLAGLSLVSPGRQKRPAIQSI